MQGQAICARKMDLACVHDCVLFPRVFTIHLTFRFRKIKTSTVFLPPPFYVYVWKGAVEEERRPYCIYMHPWLMLAILPAGFLMRIISAIVFGGGGGGPKTLSPSLLSQDIHYTIPGQVKDETPIDFRGREVREEVRKGRKR